MHDPTKSCDFLHSDYEVVQLYEAHMWHACQGVAQVAVSGHSVCENHRCIGVSAGGSWVHPSYNHTCWLQVVDTVNTTLPLHKMVHEAQFLT